MGADFWLISSEDPCQPIEADSTVIEEDDACARLGGPLASWRSEAAGHGGALRWTKTTNDAAASNFGAWRLRFSNPGDYELFVFTEGGEFTQSTQAGYQVSHAGGTEFVVLDQSSVDGWQTLGIFSFSDGEGHEVRVGDNTGEPLAADPGGVRLAFDALRVDAVDGGGDVTDDDPIDEEDADGGGLIGSFCSTSSKGGGMGAWPLFLALFALRRRRRNQ
jgi:uncharacterized protein (TIGR03382 family)